MNGFQTNTVTEIARLEEHIKVLQHQLDAKVNIAQMWEPKLSSAMTVEDKMCKISFKLNGTAITAVLNIEQVSQLDVNMLTSIFTEKFLNTVIAEKIRPLVLPHVVSLKNNAEAVMKAGSWNV